jgi:hypothetical protein
MAVDTVSFKAISRSSDEQAQPIPARVAKARSRRYIGRGYRSGPRITWIMRMFTTGYAAPLVAAFGLSAISPVSITTTSASEVKLADAGQAFASKAEAEAFLSRAVPAATAANPKYRSSGKEVATRWLAKTIAFRESQSGGPIVSIDEDIEEYRNGSLKSRGTHQATFPIDDVTVALETSDQDTTESGEKAMGVIFRCVGAPCIQTVRDGQKSTGAWTDIYLQEAGSRNRILDAFRALQKGASPK